MLKVLRLSAKSKVRPLAQQTPWDLLWKCWDFAKKVRTPVQMILMTTFDVPVLLLSVLRQYRPYWFLALFGYVVRRLFWYGWGMRKRIKKLEKDVAYMEDQVYAVNEEYRQSKASMHPQTRDINTQSQTRYGYCWGQNHPR